MMTEYSPSVNDMTVALTAWHEMINVPLQTQT